VTRPAFTWRSRSGESWKRLRVRGALPPGIAVCHERKERGDVEDRCQSNRCCAGDGGLAPRDRPAGGGPKPPQAAPVKSRGGERCGQGVPVSASGEDQEGERERTADDVSRVLTTSKPGQSDRPGTSPGVACICGLGGVRHIGGASLVQALVRNVGTCRPDSDGRSLDRCGPPAARGRTPSRDDGEGESTDAGHRDDRPVVAMKPGNAGRAKRPGHPGLVGGQPW